MVVNVYVCLQGACSMAMAYVDPENRRIGVIDAPVPQGRRHLIRKSVEVSATKNPAWTTSRPVSMLTGVVGPIIVELPI
jgi:hypothetical protein